jgi:hypothetical protein
MVFAEAFSTGTPARSMYGHGDMEHARIFESYVRFH